MNLKSNVNIATWVRSRLRALEGEVTPLVAYGAVLLMFVILILFVQNLSSLTAAQASKARQAKAEVEILKEVQSADLWEGRFLAGQAVRQEVDARIWEGITSGVIAAELQQELRKISTQNDIEGIGVRIDPEPETIEDVMVIVFEFSGRYTEVLQPVEMLVDLAAHKKQIIVRDANFSMRKSRGSILRFSGMIPVKIDANNTQPPAESGT